METIVLEKKEGKTTFTKIIVNGLIVSKRNKKTLSVDDMRLTTKESIENAVIQLTKKDYRIVDCETDMNGTPYIQERLF